jgi:glycosyltransferase involved in cell wall biosynthesis
VKVLLFSRYGPLGASSRIRMHQYLPGLAAAGIDVQISALLDDAYVRRRHRSRLPSLRQVIGSAAHRLAMLLRSRRFDLLWVEAELLPWIPAVAEGLLRRARVPFVVEFDDAIFHRYDRHPNPLVRALLGRKIDKVMRRASAVIAGNAYLASRAQAAGAARVVCLPSVVDLDRYPARQDRRPPGPIVVGWIGSPSTAPYLRLVEQPLRELQHRTEARILLIGAGGLPRFAFERELRPWVEAREANDLAAIDIGIMPLSDGPWERGKCGFKIIQYMAAGKPVVASPVGANLHIVEPGIDGFFAASPGEWLERLQVLSADETLRLRLGAAGRRKVEARYSVQVTAPRLIALFRELSPHVASRPHGAACAD